MSLETLDGPDWLDTQADRFNGQSLDMEADQARRLAQAWKEDRKTIQQLQDENTALQARITNTLRALGPHH